MQPQIKILIYICFIISLFIIQKLAFYLFALLIIFILLSRIQISSLKKGGFTIGLFILFTFISNLFYSQGKIIYSTGSIFITEEAIKIATIRSSRIFLMVAGAKILTAGIPLETLLSSVAAIFKPFKKLRLPVDEFFSTMSLSVKCIPALEKYFTENFKNTSEGIKKGNVFLKAKILSQSLIPMFIETLQKPEVFFEDTNVNF
ncbi:MAG: energy-coupling factor transporter transmembrane protein EcfT [Nitrospiraceae bacterium]|nr:energy-coupling factor transporter transmembrane protein EcfT [Nitrospiraceae bacterium]